MFFNIGFGLTHHHKLNSVQFKYTDLKGISPQECTKMLKIVSITNNRILKPLKQYYLIHTHSAQLHTHLPPTSDRM